MDTPRTDNKVTTETIHKANYKNRVTQYAGFGQYGEVPTTTCRGGKGYYSSRPPRGMLARNWKDVTCKNCLKKRPPPTRTTKP